MLFLELFLVLATQLENRRHIHFVEGGQHRCFVLGGYQSLGHLSAQHGKFRSALTTVSSGGRTHGWLCFHGIVLGDTAIFSATGNG